LSSTNPTRPEIEPRPPRKETASERLSYGTASLHIKEKIKHIMGMFKSRVLRRIFEPKRNEISR
jgi:hypothetical protein